MGVPGFYRWLVNKYPMVVARALEEEDKAEVADSSMPNPNGIDFDNLYLDMNGIIHPCFHPDDDTESPPTTFEDVFHNIYKYIDRLFNIVRPRKILYMAIDGVAPRAKMNQQRTRRFRTAKDKEIRDFEEERLRKQFEMEGKRVLPREESEVRDTNVITPGTEFMHKLSKALQAHIYSKMASHDSSWRNIMVILSDANVPGEGEQKIMSFIRQQRSLPGYDPNTRHCLYGLDADLIMLALATHEPHFSILREDVLIQEQQPKSAAKPFEFLHIWLLRESLELDMKIQEQDGSKNTSIDFERIVDDFVFICLFAGNDFLPHMPTLELHEGAIDLLITVYKKEFNKFGGYLVDMSKVEDRKAAFVKLSRVEKFILSVGTYEEKIFKKRSELRARKLRRLSRDYEAAKEEEENANLNLDPDNESSSASVFREKSFASTDSDTLQNTKELNEQLNRCIRQKSDLFKSGEFFADKIRLGSWGWKEMYYKVKFFAESPSEIESTRKEVVHKYTEGLLWILKYYYSGVPSWNWYYPFHYGPFASDLKGMGQVKMNFQKGVPFKPFDQLLAVLPPGSSHALPKSYARLMEDEQSSINDFYPTYFEVDMEGKRFTWQGICKIPFIEEGRLLNESRQLENALTGEESVRNSVGADRLFLGNSNKMSLKIMSVSDNTALKFDTTISEHGIGGVVWLCNDNVENSVLCVYHELPVDGIHNPRLLPGLKLPEKTFSENAILETQLWHECQYDNRFCRPQIRNANVDGTTKFSPYDAASEGSRSNFESTPCASFKGAGTPCASFKGAGYGRGKRSIAMGVDDKMLSLRPQQLYQTQQIVDGFKPFRISESWNGYQGEAKPCVWGRGRGMNGSASHVNYWRNVSKSSCGHQGDEKPCVWGRGRGAHGSTSHVNSWRNVYDETDSSSGQHQMNYMGNWGRGRGANGFASHVNSRRNVSEFSSHHQGDEKPCVWGRGRGAYGSSSHVNSWRNVSDNSNIDSSSGQH